MGLDEGKALTFENGAPRSLTPAWEPMRHHAEQKRLVRSRARIKLVPAGRRSGKSELAKRIGSLMQMQLLGKTKWPDPRIAFCAPTHDQAKKIFWNHLKALIPPVMINGKPRESELMIPIVGGGEIWVMGMDKPERIEGTPWDHVVLDEYANMKKEAWPMHVRPALSDRKGTAWLIGVPEGMNHYYDLCEKAKIDRTGQMDVFAWWSEDILDADEIESAKDQLDEITYLQEYRAEFVTFAGRAYYCYDHRANTYDLDYRPLDPLIVCFDFNVKPGVAAVIQEIPIAGSPDPEDTITAVIAEVYIPQHSTTERVCRKIHEDWGDHLGDIYLYGDATGGAGGSAKNEGSDWEIIERYFHQNFETENRAVYMRVPASNMRERARVNAVNSRCCSLSGQRRLLVDKDYAPYTHRDFMGTRVLDGTAGELDKKTDKMLTHLTDAIGYYVAQEFPVREGTVETVEERF